MSELSPATRAVVRAARRALDEVLDEARTFLLGASGAVDMESKHDGTPVSDADLELDRRLSTLLERFPDHGMLSEERTTIAPDTTWTWIVDPIDGTSNYICRLPYWCVSVALAYEGVPVLGVVDAPVLGRRYLAERGAGAEVVSRNTSLDGADDTERHRTLAVRGATDWRDPANAHVPVMLTTGTARAARGAGLALNPRVMGSTALDLAIVAEGVAASSVARIPKVWDIAAGVLLVEEAGGVVSHLDEPPMFPLSPGTEYAEHPVLTVAGSDEAEVRSLATSLLDRS
ncbi:MAG: inositol monophosphatase [Nitriliruptoraceae bacterium]|nr:inositol monophosphatase [Nitriliruptoraceae bacterium]